MKKSGHVFVTQGDLSRLSAHVVVYSTDRKLSPGGQLTSAFDANVPGFRDAYRALRDDLQDRTLDAGDTFFLPGVDPQASPVGTVVAVAAAGARDRAESASRAARGALACACEALERREIPKPWLVGLPTFLAGDGGARADRARVAEPQFEAAEHFVRQVDGLDVAFVAFTEANYQVWLRARRRVRERIGAGDLWPEPPPGLVRALQHGECVVFAGAGLSARSGLPSWHALIEELADALGVPRSQRHGDLEYLLDLAQWYRNEGTRPSIEELVASRFTSAASGAKPTLTQYFLAALPARYFVTTNYDDLLEVALRSLRKHPTTIVREEDVPRTGSHGTCYVVKFHGCASNGGSVVLSRDDYDEFFRTRPAMALLLEGLLLNQSFFFLGYGLRDPDFRQIWSRIAAMLRGSKRPAFATVFDPPTGLASRQWADKGLELVAVEGSSGDDRTRALDAMLDRLGELVSLDPHLFLAEDVDVTESSEVGALRKRLLAGAGELIDACERSGSGSRGDALAALDLLRFYASHGWRGAYPGQLGALFAALGEHSALDPTEKREVFVAALRFTENAREAAKLEARIARLAAGEAG